MTPHDPRHGTRAGYLAHRKDHEPACEACLRGRRREDKGVRVDNERGVPMLYPADDIRRLLEPWLTLGFTYSAIGNAADLGGTHGSRLHDRIAAGRPFRRGTYRALAALTEDAFQGSATVYADLTRTRIYSLMAAGHQLIDMPVLPNGRWRHQRVLTVEQARAVRDYYTAHQHHDGTSVHSRNRARRAGHQPPAAWDDPGTLAWPVGWTSDLTVVEEVDEVAVQRILSGDWRQPANRAERVEVIRRWTDRGVSLNEIARRTGWKTERYFKLSEQVAS